MTVRKFEKKFNLLPAYRFTSAGWVANSVDPDQTPHSAASDLRLHYLPRPVCPNNWNKYGILQRFNQIIGSNAKDHATFISTSRM